ncbi:MAG TPA: alternative ribosome rescue aminoacyl-tRNA hydrolase ArfB [Longimicrobiaceae bacterium]|nr:alternative ribosome rescue aminoacyl-tRNA hydrolase ArfB [Longimicrobiaceae bacterium]
MDDVITITDDVFIPATELTFRATRSGGPGGQHVNTSSTRVELAWSAGASPNLTDRQRARVMDKLANRINSEGVLLLTEGGSRSQHKNKEAVVERFKELLAEALHIPKPRKRTRPPRASRERRIEAKKHRAEIKRMRGPVRRDE